MKETGKYVKGFHPIILYLVDIIISYSNENAFIVIFPFQFTL